MGFPDGSVVKHLPAMQEMCRRQGFILWVGEIPWRRKWQAIPVFWPGKAHRQRSLVRYSPWGHKDSDTTDWLNTNDTDKGHHHNLCYVFYWQNINTWLFMVERWVWYQLLKCGLKWKWYWNILFFWFQVDIISLYIRQSFQELTKIRYI